MKSRMWKLYILCILLSGFLNVHSAEDFDGQNAIKGDSHSLEKKRQELIPYPRMGRSNKDEPPELKLLQKDFDKKSTRYQHPNTIATQKQSGKNTDLEDVDYDVSEYLLPYPRPGRSENGVSDGSLDQQSTMLPYPRLGKSSIAKRDSDEFFSFFREPNKQRKMDNTEVDEFDISGQFMTPYPRLGKRNEENSVVLPYQRLDTKNDFLTPYPRLGRNEEYLTPYPRLGRNKEYLTPYPRLGRNEEYLTPYPRLGRNEEYLTPYPRLGRNEEYLTPYPRLGRNEEYLTPYPRLGRSDDFLTPYPRLGKQSSDDMLLPYPRLGRSDNGYHKLAYLASFPRIRRKQSYNDAVITISPFSRKRSANDDIMLPYPRLGKRTSEDTILPYPRMGKSQKSGSMHQLEEDEEDIGSPYMTPYPRPGRRISQPTNFESNNRLKNALPETPNNVHFLYGRERKSDNSESRRNGSIADDSSDEEDGVANTMIPNFRFGRSQNKINLHIRKRRSPSSNENEILLPYPRLGRNNDVDHSQNENSNEHSYDSFPGSLYNFPYGRHHRANDNVDPKMWKKILKLTTTLKDIPDQDTLLNEYYMLPYPRPGK